MRTKPHVEDGAVSKYKEPIPLTWAPSWLHIACNFCEKDGIFLLLLTRFSVASTQNISKSNQVSCSHYSPKVVEKSTYTESEKSQGKM